MVETIPNNCGTTRHLSQQINDTLIASQRIGLGSRRAVIWSSSPTGSPEPNNGLQAGAWRRSRAASSDAINGHQAVTSGCKPQQAATRPQLGHAPALDKIKKKEKPPAGKRKAESNLLQVCVAKAGSYSSSIFRSFETCYFLKNKIFNRKKNELAAFRQACDKLAQSIFYKRGPHRGPSAGRALILPRPAEGGRDSSHSARN